MTLNLALDITYTTDTMVVGEVNRVEHTHTHAGGKGVNVARLLTAWGTSASVLGFAGGDVGAGIADSLEEGDVAHELIPCAESSRRTVTVVSTCSASPTGLYEAGPTILAAEWEALGTAYEKQLPAAGVVVLSGSLPPGVPRDAYRQLTATARARGLPVIIDAHGKPLLHALDAGPSIVTPNEAELADAVGLSLPIALDSVVEASQRLLSRGATRVVATLGARGLIGLERERAWLASAPRVDGNPTGAGDAVAAVLADSELAGHGWPEALHRAAATAAAAVRMPVAGAADPGDVEELFEKVEVREL